MLQPVTWQRRLGPLALVIVVGCRAASHADVDLSQLRVSPLYNAIWKQAPYEQIKMLIEEGANADEVDPAGRTPLHWAAGSARADVVQLLLDAGARPERCDFEGKTALHALVMGRVIDRHPDAASEFPLHDSFRTAEALIKGGVPINAKDRFGDTALHHTARLGDGESAELLLVHGADPDARDNSRQTTLHYAAAGLLEEGVVMGGRRRPFQTTCAPSMYC